MGTCLDILREQIKTLISNYSGFVGSFNNTYEFSNYTIMEESNRLPIYIKQYRQINAKLKKIYPQILALQDEIFKL